MSSNMNNTEDDTPTDELIQSHLDWTSKQGLILTANGRANEFYSEARGFPCSEEELPHYHLLEGSDTACFSPPTTKSPIVGAWSRDYFVGGWHHSCNRDETVFNLQTNSLFIDLRIPTSRNQILRKVNKLQDYTNFELRLYARQHVFCGMSIVEQEENRPVCTRHHFLDWNFVGVPRPRPNKWWIEFQPSGGEVWKEWAYATDEHGQHYYCEQWSRLDGNDGGVVVALRKERLDDTEEDGILVVVGDHFNYIRGRALAAPSLNREQYENATSLVTLVDAALEAGDRETAIAWLGRIQAGHGRIGKDHAWKIDCAIEPWKEGSLLFQESDVVVVDGTDVSDCTVIWNDERWNVFDTSLESVEQVKDLFEKKSLS
jgi:hypothetical protein